METAINGVCGDPLTRRINASTSAGYGFPGKKKMWIPVTTSEGNEIVREPVDELKQRLLYMIECYRKGETAGTIYTAHLKDEARLTSKNIHGKTRVFYASPLDALILARMVLYPFFTLMMEFPEIFCTSIGVDMHTGSERVMKRLFDFSPNILEGDYAGYDTNQPHEMRLLAVTIILDILEYLGYNEEALMITKGVLSEYLFVTISMLEEILGISSMQPSGSYGTAEFNSLVGLLLLVYAWITENDEDFFDNVIPTTYGDDVVASVSASHTWFNNIWYGKFCFDHYGMGFTSTDKGIQDRKYLTPETCSFLKRTFEYSPVLQRLVGKLSMESIVRSAIFYIPSKSVTREKQIIDISISTLWEYFFHCHNQSEYEKVRIGWISIIHEIFQVPQHELCVMLPHFDILFDRFKSENAGDVWAPPVISPD
jgi:hypothetical protein